MKYLGVDFGTKRTGIAMSDENAEFAFPSGVVASESAMKEIVALCKKEPIKGIIVGRSIASNEAENDVQKNIDRFAAHVELTTGLPVLFEREDFSSVEAHRYQTDAGKRDDSAAAIILQRFLDKKKKAS